MSRLVMSEGRVVKEQLPPMQEQPKPPQYHVWFMVRGVWYPIGRETAKRKGYVYQENEPEGQRCEDWERRIATIEGQALRYGY